MASPRRGTLAIALSGVVCALLLLAPRIAAACPYCAANDDKGDAMGQLFVLGGFILLPFAVAAVVVFVIVRAVRRARDVEAHAAQRHPGDW